MAKPLHFEASFDPEAEAYRWQLERSDGANFRFSRPGPSLFLTQDYFPTGTLSTLQVRTLRRVDVEYSHPSETFHLVPEPAAGLLLVAGLVGLGLIGGWWRCVARLRLGLKAREEERERCIQAVQSVTMADGNNVLSEDEFFWEQALESAEGAIRALAGEEGE